MVDLLSYGTALDGFPGAPFTPSQVRAAGEQVRVECGWHIAPTVTETLTLDSAGGRVLTLPTLRLVAVTEVRDVTGDTPEVLTGWRQSKVGMLSRVSWPVGFAAVEVDLTHGYPECPPDLLAVLAERCQRFGKDGFVRQESLGSRSVTLGAAGPGPSTLVLSRYTIHAQP